MFARVHAATACFWLTIAVILVIDLRLVVTHLVTTCGGLDSAGYVGSARLLLSGHFMQYEPIARVLPFSNATAAAAPLGFVASGQPSFISPRFPPGLPLLMAVALAAGGRVGPFVIAPALAIATVVLVFRFARRTSDPVTAGLAATLTAITPIFVEMALQPMSDVPATFWVVLSGSFLWRPHPRATPAALAAGMAILTRVVVCAKGIVAIGRPRDHPASGYVVGTIAAILLAGGSYAFLQRQHVFDLPVEEQRYRLVSE
jgi:hypothetical protein